MDIGFPQAFGLCTFVAVIICLVFKMFISEEKPFTKKWFIDIISFIPEGI